VAGNTGPYKEITMPENSRWGSVSFSGSSGGSAGPDYFNAKPITINVNYDEGSTMPDIGGSVCHLCGKPTKFKNTYQRYNKRDTWVSRIYLTYGCGTEVFTNEKNVKKVTLGSKCIKPPVHE
jgi:hypothetical protein